MVVAQLRATLLYNAATPLYIEFHFINMDIGRGRVNSSNILINSQLFFNSAQLSEEWMCVGISHKTKIETLPRGVQHVSSSWT